MASASDYSGTGRAGSRGWQLPAPDTPYYDHDLAAVVTLGELLAQVIPERVPRTRDEYEEFLHAFDVECLVDDGLGASGANPDEGRDA